MNAASFCIVMWLYVLIGTAGFVTLVPTILRALDQHAPDPILGSLGFGCSTMAVTGLCLQRFGLSGTTVFTASVALGLAAGALHPELVALLHRSGGKRIGAPEPAPQNATKKQATPRKITPPKITPPKPAAEPDPSAEFDADSELTHDET